MRKLFPLATIFLVFLCVFLSITFFQKGAEGSAGFVGAAVCKNCHEPYYNSYMESLHAKKEIPNSPATKQECETCHGPAVKHLEAGGGRGSGRLNFGKSADAEMKSSKCLSCHGDSKHLASWNLSKHQSAGVSCDKCHEVHGNKYRNLKASEPELCYGCHRDIRFEANKQSHHPIREGKVSCSACHNSHGSFGEKMIKADSVNELCYKCHADKRGPYMWEHPPVEENCMSCHTAHGSNHSKLLVSKTPQLCQSCHDWSRHPGTPYTKADAFTSSIGAAPSNKLVSRNCQNCHTNIHGSNGPGTHGLRFVR
ncbi:MAG: DmsE family decaheme c-type cytochrome [Alphaproteobacteria bacterium]|uniref:DmsE family decaheme c-type cytochrome n=1 Tax=Candidatus Nitrobium versatile TaxID=2884831 RepID=A0A953LZ89_9BACT|nr:DmsE family decaheme c-type cytochrome [Candidatus Nitrobium versatile]